MYSLQSFYIVVNELTESLRNSSSHEANFLYIYIVFFKRGVFAGGSDSKEFAYNAGDLGSIPGLGRSPGEGRGNPLQYSCLENPIDRGAWRATILGGCRESDTTEQLTHRHILKNNQTPQKKNLYGHKCVT